MPACSTCRVALIVIGVVSACAKRAETVDIKQPASNQESSIQEIAREEIDRAVLEWKPAAAVVVILDPATGSILAVEGRNRGRADPSLASRQPYVTGSTLKTITIAAALDARTIGVDDRVDCASRLYGNAKLVDPNDHGTLSVSDVLAVSSNVGTSRVYDTLGLERLMDALHRFHIGDPPSALPVVADGTSMRAAVLAAGELAKATPLQVAAAYAAIVNDGVYLAPMPASVSAKRVPVRVLRSDTAQTVVGMLEKSVTSDLGSGKLARIEGMRVAGKTGTGDLDPENRDGGAYASFVGTVLDREPKIVILVGLEAPQRGGTGPSAAAPMFARVARRLVRR